jgi:hypothetical protein
MISWTMAGGIAAGGVLLGALAMTGLVEPGVHLFAAEALFLVGAVVGLVHATALGILGRPDCLTFGGALWRSLLSGVLCVPALLLAWVVTAGMTSSAALLTSWKLSWLVLAVVSWGVGLSLCAWAAYEGWSAARRGIARWAPGFGGRSAAAALAVGCLGGVLAWRPPEALGIDLQLTAWAAIPVGIGIAISLGVPLVCAAHTLRRHLASALREVASEPAPS